MARLLIFLAAAALFGVGAAVHEDCEVPPPTKFATIQIKSEEDVIRAFYTCEGGYELQGPNELVCDIDTDEWNTDPPQCVQVAVSNEVEDSETETAQQKQQQKQAIPEDRMVSPALASTLDMSCVQAKVKAPEIRHGIVQKYERRRKGDRVFLAALYACNDNFDFEDPDMTTLYCSNRAWVGDLPTCIPLSEYDDEEGLYEYEEGDEEDDEDVAEEEDDDEEQRHHNYVPPPPPPTRPTDPPTSYNENVEHLSNEITPLNTQNPAEEDHQQHHNEEEEEERTHVVEQEVTNSVTAEATQDPYEPRVLDENCGSDNGGCDQKCQRVLFPGENEPRIQCACAEGFSLDPYDYSTCHDINECELPEVAQECPHGCENTDGSYRCLTQEVTQEKEDIAPNTDDVEDPPKNEVSSESPPVVQQCEPGFRLEHDQCVDIDECAEGISGCQICINTEGSYECTCPSGYDLAEDEKTCVDIDECAIVSEDEEYAAAYRVCSHGCHNTDGSFVCFCPPLYHLSEDGRTCDVDTCADLENPALNKSRCSYECTDLATGGFQCHCPEGYALADTYNCVQSQTACELNSGVCAPGSCQEAENEFGFQCICPVGYREENNRCVDVDECADGSHECSHQCVNTEGNYICKCPQGYILPYATAHSCEDVNECEHQPEICGELKCQNFPGSFTCLCEDGSEPNAEGICASMVANVDPCAESRCSHECVAEGDTYRCGCPAGWDLDESQLTCIQSEACDANKNGCDHICNADGSCSCQDGFALGANGKTCLDIDECQVNNGGCHHLCINVEGSYACSCEAGFQLADDEKTCLDIDECALGKHDCSHDCINVDGGYKCSCPQGYYLGEKQSVCVDLNECNADDHGCSHDCYNTMGSYLCACPDGFVLSSDEKTCINSMCFENNGGCSHQCDPDQGCSCPPGMILGLDGKTCEDVDECTADNGGCAFKCVNLPGSYECVCPDGSKPANPFDACPITCPAGFTFSRDDPSKCEDIDECSLPGVCQYQCRNTNGSYECLCPKGYRLENGRDCQDIDECAENNGGCLGGECINHNGGHECRCPLGHRLAADRKTCEVVQELRDQCHPLTAPANGAIHCTKYRHKKRRFYSTRCKVWCNPGFELQGPTHRHCNATGQWDQHDNLCLPKTCPPLATPLSGVITPPACLFGQISVGEQCLLKCNAGHVPVGASVAVCTSQLQWSYNGTFDCWPMQTEPRLGVSNGFTPLALPNAPPPLPPTFTTATTTTLHNTQSTFGGRPLPGFDFKVTPFGGGSTVGSGGVGLQRPYIKCPRNTTVYLAPSERTTHVILQKPITNLDYRYIESSPAWTRDLQAHLGPGTYVVVFRGHDPISGKKARCKTVIHVKHADGPVVEYCTPSFEVSLGENQVFRSVVWEEPRFSSKYGPIKKLYKSRLPGELFGVGVHSVYYEATNEDGLTAKCEFKIRVNSAGVSSQSHLTSNSIEYGGHRNKVPKLPNFHSVPRPSPIFTSPVLQPPPPPPPHLTAGPRPNAMKAPLLAGHESFIICPGRDPVKVTSSQSVELPPNCILKNVRINPFRQFMSQRVMPRLWASHGLF
ncbi:latent-transforming growth factor beta-binding protein 4 isoform X2 [Musca domestica]|uniref:Latent-transforming growth factor beta-binding protein 4 isoform X2 n=1 Tax=Musca domestica TaxID=7370 RepID=A0A1I8MCS8_MUSDO|nr:latent-transforming growth factor beta-binding protein 4 isoform X2 [Musca domestica]